MKESQLFMVLQAQVKFLSFTFLLASGKTEVLLRIVYTLVHSGEHVLVTSSKNKTVDDLLKSFIRLYPSFHTKCLRLTSKQHQLDDNLKKFDFVEVERN